MTAEGAADAVGGRARVVVGCGASIAGAAAVLAVVRSYGETLSAPAGSAASTRLPSAAVFLYPRLAPPGVRFIDFALFIGIAMSITALPVLARILADLRLTGTDLGVVALASILLLPAFFALAGMRTEIGLISGIHAWMAFGLILVVATLGKFGGTFLAARLGGLERRTAAALGALMNTRGLVELIVLNVGLDLGILTPPLFTMLVLMALATPGATTPVVCLLVRDPVREPRSARACQLGSSIA